MSFKNCGVQTVYRESDAQTIPWEPPIKIKSGHPEVLELDFLQWGVNLPAGRHEIDLIEFLRKKKAWEKYMARICRPENVELRKRILMDMEKSESNFREKVLDDEIQELMRLARRQLTDYFEAREDRYNAKVAACFTRAEQEKQKRLRAIECKKKRELKKIQAKEKGINAKYHKMTPFEEYCDPKSDFYVNIARFGENPRYRDETLLPECYTSSLKAYRSVKPKDLARNEPEKRTYKSHNCEPVLEEISAQEFLTAMKEDESSTIAAKKVMHEDTGKTDSSLIQSLLPGELEKFQQAAILIQSLIRGRAVQTLMVKGRRKQQDLIDEIKSTHAFVDKDKPRVNYARALILKKLRQYHYYLKMIGQVAYVHERLTGATLSSLADVAYKEMERIEGERRAHVMVEWAERTRMRREAAEGGRRQKEQRLRSKHDEYYKHVMRKTEITTETYLNLLKKAAVFNISKKEADYSAKQKADEIDKEATDETKREIDFLERQEIGAQLLHDFYLPRFTRQASGRYKEEASRKSQLIAEKLVNRELNNVFEDDSRRRKETHLLFSDKPIFNKARRPTLVVCKCKKTSDIKERSSSFLKDLRRICSISSTTSSSKDYNQLLEDLKKEKAKASLCKEKLKRRIEEMKLQRGIPQSEESGDEEDAELFIASRDPSMYSSTESLSSAPKDSPVGGTTSSSPEDQQDKPHSVPSFISEASQPEIEPDLEEDGHFDQDHSISKEEFTFRPLTRTRITTRGNFTDEKLTELAESVAEDVLVEAETRHFTLKSAKESVVQMYRTSYLEADDEKTEGKRPSFFHEGVVEVEEEGEVKEIKPTIAEHYSAADKWNEQQIMRSLEIADKYPD